MATKELPSIRDHADKLKADIIKAQGVKPDPNGAATAALVPEFSKGTRAIDDNTGQPIGPGAPEFTDTTVALPEGTETTGAADAERERDPSTGRFVGQAAEPIAGQEPIPAAAPVAQSVAAPAQAEAGTAAAEAVAAAVADEFEEWEFQDPDLEVPIKLRYDKKFHNTVQRAFPRRADYDRLRNRLGEAEPILRPMLENGSIKQVLPLLQMAQNDREYADAVWAMYQRRTQGLPLVEQAIAQAQALNGQAQPQQFQPQPQDAPFSDPLLESALQPYEQRWQQKYAQVESKLNTWEQQRQAEESQRRQEQQRQAGIANEMMAAHSDLAQMFPGEFNTALGPNDPGWQKAQGMTQQGGYAQTYGIRAGLIFGYQRAREIEQERLAATASPAAQSLADLDNRQVELARRQAAESARTAAGGAPANSAPPAPRQRPSTKDGQGKMKPPDQFLGEMTAWAVEQQQRTA